MGKIHRQPGKAGGGKRSLVTVWNNQKYNRPAAPVNDATAWQSLTAQLVMARAGAGTLDPAIVAALLMAMGLL